MQTAEDPSVSAPSPDSEEVEVDLLALVPTAEEIARAYPPRWTWLQLRQFVASGELGLLKRDPALQVRCYAWYDRVLARHASLAAYLVDVRLGWTHAPPPPPDAVFTATAPQRDTWAILRNDWPYSVPHDIVHSLVWSRLPFLRPADADPANSVLADIGLWGFSGGADAALADAPPLDPDVQARADARIGPDPAAVRAAVAAAGTEVAAFVRAHWPEDEWETAWFVNPPRLQSIPGLAHAHVFARPKTPAATVRP